MPAPLAPEDDHFRIADGDQRGEHAAQRGPDSRADRAGHRAAAIEGIQQHRDIDRRRAGLAQPEFLEHLGEQHRASAWPDGDQVRDFPGDAGEPAAHLPVADHRAAQALAKMQVGEICQLTGRYCRALGPRFPVHVVVDQDRAVDGRAEHVGWRQLADKERGIRQVNQPAATAIDGVGGTDHAQAHGAVAGGRGQDLPGHGPQGALDLPRPGRPGQRLPHAGEHRTVTVEAFRHHTVRRDADDESGADVLGEPVVRADPPAPAGPGAGVANQAGGRQPPRALGHRGLGDAGPGCQLCPGQLALCHQSTQDVLIGQGAQQVQRGLRHRHGT